jgi:predicted nucleic acid-binding protein
VSGNILLDTNIVIGLFRNDESILAHFSEIEGVFLPSIVVGELYFGAYKSAQSECNIRRGLLPSEWVNWGKSFSERLAGEEVSGFFYRGKSGQAFLRLHADHPSPL